MKNEATGSLTLVKLKPEECLLLVEKMNRKSFLGRQLFVTSVVAESPVKTAPVLPTPDNPAPGGPGSVQICPGAQSAAKPGAGLAEPVNFNLGPKLIIPSNSVSDTGLDTDSLATEYVWGPVSPSVQEKIDQLQQQSSGSKFSNMSPLDSKRKSEGSPEDSALSRKEKKILKSEEKKLRKQ